MLQGCQIDGYRGIQHLGISGFSRVNLLVGRNNAGKTSVLEALQLLLSEGDVFSAIESMDNRGEYIYQVDEGPYRVYDVSHLFFRHQAPAGTRFSIAADGPGGSVVWEISGRGEGDQLSLSGVERSAGELALVVTRDARKPRVYPLTDEGGLSLEYLRRRMRPEDLPGRSPVQLLPTAGLRATDLGQLWGQIALTDLEPEIIRALNLIDPEIEQVAYLGGRRMGASRADYGSAGMFARVKGSSQRVPLGSMGEGIRRILCLAMAVILCKRGTLLVDEIDTGLHYSVLPDLWKFLRGITEELDVQLFATTHSNDCIEALARSSEGQASDGLGAASLHRIDRLEGTATAYAEEEISLALAHEMELR